MSKFEPCDVCNDLVLNSVVGGGIYPGIQNGGVVTTAGYLVIQGDNSGFLNIYDAQTGRKLWTFDGGSPILAAPIVYAVNGRQYLTVLAGYGGSIGISAGEAAWGPNGPWRNKSRVLTFALDGKATLPPGHAAIQTMPEPPAQFADAPSIAVGRELFANTCEVCHGGFVRSAGVIPDLRYGTAIGDRDAWRRIVGEGLLADNGMANFSADYSPQEIEAIRAYVISRAQEDFKAGVK